MTRIFLHVGRTLCSPGDTCTVHRKVRLTGRLCSRPGKALTGGPPCCVGLCVEAKGPQAGRGQLQGRRGRSSKTGPLVCSLRSCWTEHVASLGLSFHICKMELLVPVLPSSCEASDCARSIQRIGVTGKCEDILACSGQSLFSGVVRADIQGENDQWY